MPTAGGSDPHTASGNFRNGLSDGGGTAAIRVGMSSNHAALVIKPLVNPVQASTHFSAKLPALGNLRINLRHQSFPRTSFSSSSIARSHALWGS